MTQKNVIKKKKISKSKSRYSSQSSTRKSSEVDSDTKDVTEEENANQSTLMTNNGNNGAASFRRSKSANKIAMGLARSLKKVSVSGSVHGRNVIIVDDMIDTGITLKNAVEVKYSIFLKVVKMMGRLYLLWGGGSYVRQHYATTTRYLNIATAVTTRQPRSIR